MAKHSTRAAVLSMVLIYVYSTMSQAAEELYTNQPSVTPELALAGEYSVGVTTLKAINPQQLNASDFKSIADRPLTLEVWYPASVAPNAIPSTYKNLTRSHKEFELQATAYRDAAPLDNIAMKTSQLTVKESKQFPLIVLSHGYTGYRTIMFYLGEHLASHGYIVVGIDHTDSTNADIDFSAAPGAGFLSTLRNRARDQQFVLDFFTKHDSEIANITNTDKAAIIAYSMGGYGAINTVGGCYAFTAPALQAVGVPAEHSETLLPVFNSCNGGRESTDPRWKSMLAFSPWGGELNIHSTESLNSIKVPSLYVAGSLDDIVGFENGVKSLFNKAGSPETMLMVYQNARHNIAAHPAPQVAYQDDLDIGHHYEPSWDIETLNRINKHMSLAFLNCYVKELDSFCSYLPVREDIAQTKLSDGKLSQTWPGFKERWGTGVSFYRK